jgi:Fic family protein
MSSYPPFNITPLILMRSQEIAHELGLLEGARMDALPIKLRRINNIMTIQASLAIEGNTLGVEQITQILEGKRVMGPTKDILEVKNAIDLYDDLKAYNPLAMDDLLKAHQVLMKDLIKDNGKWRRGGVGILKGDELKHLAPAADRVPFLMADLFKFLNKSMMMTWLIKACVFHYEFEFIHPFSDGNGRMGRLWQQLILMKENPLFRYIPIEVLIKDNQALYYQVLEDCDQAGESTLFIEFSLEQILNALKRYTSDMRSTIQDPASRLQYAQQKLAAQWFSRKDYLNLHKDISTATASRDLVYGVENGMLQKRGEKNQIQYCFV